MEIGEGRELKKSEERLKRLDKESETTRLLVGRVEMVERASNIAKHSLVNEEAEEGGLWTWRCVNRE